MKVSIIDGHPNSESFIASLVQHYAGELERKKHEVKIISIRGLKFNPNLEKGYQQIQELEPDLLKAQEDIKWCQHLALFYPMWWGLLMDTFFNFGIIQIL